MTKSEKRYFRMMTDLQKGNKLYLILFNHLEKLVTFDDETLNKLEEVFPGNRIEPARKHLFQVMMKSLRQFDADKETESRLTNLLQNSRILYNKGLIRLSFDQLGKAKQIAIENEKFMYYILAARQELQYLVRSQFAGLTEFDLLEKQKMIREMLGQENKINQHAMLYEVLLLRYWQNGIVRSQEEVIRLNDLLLEEYHLLNAPGEKSFNTQQLHLHFQSIYFQMTGDPEGSLNIFYELDGLFQQYEHLWRDEPLYYFHLLDGILYNLRWMERYQDMDFFRERMKAIAPASYTLGIMVKYCVIEHELNQLVDCSKFTRAEEMLRQYNPSLNREAAHLPFQMRAQLMFAVVRVWVGVGNYSAAIKVINRSLNQAANSMNPSSYTIFQLINLQVNALLNNTDYLYYAIRSVERKLKGERKLFEAEKLLLSMLKKWMAYKPLSEYEAQLNKLLENPYERQLIKELCIEEWFRRMTGKVGIG